MRNYTDGNMHRSPAGVSAGRLRIAITKEDVRHMKHEKHTQCPSCKYHTKIEGTAYCYYAGIRKVPCSKLVGGVIYDRRGSDPDNCRLFEKGKEIKDDVI